MDSEQHICCEGLFLKRLKMSKNTSEVQKRTYKQIGQDIIIINPCPESMSLVLHTLGESMFGLGLTSPLHK